MAEVDIESALRVDLERCRSAYDQLERASLTLTEERDRLRAALEGIRGLFVTDRWWTGNRARYVVQLIDAALEGRDG